MKWKKIIRGNGLISALWIAEGLTTENLDESNREIDELQEEAATEQTVRELSEGE